MEFVKMPLWNSLWLRLMLCICFAAISGGLFYLVIDSYSHARPNPSLILFLVAIMVVTYAAISTMQRRVRQAHRDKDFDVQEGLSAFPSGLFTIKDKEDVGVQNDSGITKEEMFARLAEKRYKNMLMNRMYDTIAYACFTSFGACISYPKVVTKDYSYAFTDGFVYGLTVLGALYMIGSFFFARMDSKGLLITHKR